MYVAARGGEGAIRAAHRLLAKRRRGDEALPEITDRQVAEQLSLAVDRVMAEGALHDEGLAALAVRQARGDLIEAVFLVRAYRTTLPRIGTSEPVDTARMALDRRISATFKDVPGGQLLGPTFDYTHRLLDFALAAEAEADGPPPEDEPDGADRPAPRVTDLLGADALIEPAGGDEGSAPGDITREPLAFPASRAVRLQALARADEGFLLALAYSTQRGHGSTHAFVGEVRVGTVAVELFLEEVGMTVEIGAITLTEVETVNQFAGSGAAPPAFTRGYGLAFGHSERKAISMALVDRALRAGELGEAPSPAPARDEAFVLSHADNVKASGFLEHLKLPHYVDFQAELALLRRLRAEWERARTEGEADGPEAGA